MKFCHEILQICRNVAIIIESGVFEFISSQGASIFIPAFWDGVGILVQLVEFLMLHQCKLSTLMCL